MKTNIALLLALSLMATLFAGCGKESTTNTATTDNGTTTIIDTTTTVAADPDTTVSDDTTATTTTESATTTTKRPESSTTATTTVKSAITTTTKRATTSTTKKASSMEQLLNAAPLHPEKTNAPLLDKMIDTIFAKIHTTNMTTYDKVKACYDYLVDNFTYGSDMFNFFAAYAVLEDRLYDSAYDEQLVLNAYSLLSSSIGVCDDYSAAFAVMCRRIGLDAFVRGGSITNVNGETQGHAWATITLNGIPYIFDPQVQTRSSSPYSFFGRSYTQQGKTSYELSQDIYDPALFRHFACETIPEATTTTVTPTTTTATEAPTTTTTDAPVTTTTLPPSTATPSSTTVVRIISKEQAKAIALQHAGLTDAIVQRVEAERDFERDILLYEVEFDHQGYEYSYEIHAETGEILHSGKERDD